MQTKFQTLSQPVLFAVLIVFVGLTHLVTAAPLDKSIQRLITQTSLGGGVTSVYVANLDSGEVLVDYEGSRALIPASSMKVLTTGAALYVLGDEFTFRTELILDETQSPPTLIIKGDGDPALGDPAIFAGEEPGTTLDTLFDQVADALIGAGVSELSRVIIDDTVFDRTYTHPCWPTDQLNRWYCAQVAGLNLHTNVINVYTIPSGSGGTPIVNLQPDAFWVEMQIKAKSNPKKRNTAWVSRPTLANIFTVHGNVSSKAEIPVATNSPAEFAGHLIAMELSDRSISVGIEQESPRDAVALISPSDHYRSNRTVAVITTPIFDVLERTNAFSHNLYAEALLKRIGHAVTSDPGSWENGSTVIRMLLTEKLGPGAAESTVIADGSGMCRDNRVSPKTMSNWIRKLARTDHWESFRDSLAIPGKGTLRNRFQKDTLNAQLYAKSGYLSGTYSLSGVLVHPRTGQRVVFSIMLNDVKSGATSRNAKPLVDRIVRNIDEWMNER